jgi:hypothetical protein
MADSVLPIIDAKKAEFVISDHALNHIRLMPTSGHTPDHFMLCAGCGGDEAGVHRLPDPLADPGALSRPRDVRRLRPEAGLGHSPRLSRALLRHQHLVLHNAVVLTIRRAHQALGNGFRCEPVSG